MRIFLLADVTKSATYVISEHLSLESARSGRRWIQLENAEFDKTKGTPESPYFLNGKTPPHYHCRHLKILEVIE